MPTATSPMKGIRGPASAMPAYEITPLGAAVVEATTIAQRRLITATFKRTGYCPTSRIFPTQEDVKSFYAQPR